MRTACWECGGDLEDRQVSVEGVRDGQVIVVPDVAARVCVLCGDRTFNSSALEQIEQAIEANA